MTSKNLAKTGWPESRALRFTEPLAVSASGFFVWTCGDFLAAVPSRKPPPRAKASDWDALRVLDKPHRPHPGSPVTKSRTPLWKTRAGSYPRDQRPPSVVVDGHSRRAETFRCLWLARSPRYKPSTSFMVYRPGVCRATNLAASNGAAARTSARVGSKARNQPCAQGAVMDQRISEGISPNRTSLSPLVKALSRRGWRAWARRAESGPLPRQGSRFSRDPARRSPTAAPWPAPIGTYQRT